MNDTSNLNAKTKRELSERERGIILDLAHGKTVKEIARALNISYQSVFQKLSHARAKMQATTTYHLIYLVAVQSQETHHAANSNQNPAPHHPLA